MPKTQRRARAQFPLGSEVVGSVGLAARGRSLLGRGDQVGDTTVGLRLLEEVVATRPLPRHKCRTVPRIRDRIEMYQAGIPSQGTVHYADELQVLVKWDNGQSSSLRMERARFKIIERA